MTACHLAVAALAAFVGLASAEKEFPLVWICLGLTAVGILIALYVAYRRPMEPYSPEGPAAEPFDEGEERQESIAAPSQGAASHHSAHSSPKNTVLSSTSTCCKDLTLILYGNLVFLFISPDGGIAPACCSPPPPPVFVLFDAVSCVLSTCPYRPIDFHSSTTTIQDCAAAPLLLLACRRRCLAALDSRYVRSLCPLFPALSPSALPFFFCSCCRSLAVVLFRLPPSYPPPTSLSLSPALPTLMTACHLAVAALAAFVGLASAEKEFPLVWICLGLTAVGILIALYVAYRRPMEPYSPEGPAAEPFDEGEERQESIAAPSQGAASHHSAHSSPKNTVLSSTSTCCKDLTLILYGNLVFFYSFPPMAVSPPPVVVPPPPPVFVLFDAVSCVLSTCPYRPIGFHSSTTTIQDCAAAPLLLLACRRRCLAALDSRYVRSLCPLFPALSPSALPFFICSCCRCPAVVLFRLPPSYPPPTSLSLSPALPTLMTACHLAVAALAAFVGLASAEKEFPLVWICLGLTAVGILIALYVAYRRPMEPYSPEGPAAEPFDEGEERQESIAAPSQGAASHHSAHSSPKNTVLSSTSTCCKDLTLILYGNLVFSIHFPDGGIAPPVVLCAVNLPLPALTAVKPGGRTVRAACCTPGLPATAPRWTPGVWTKIKAKLLAPVPRRSGQSLRTVTVSTLSCPLPLRFAFLHLFLLSLPCSCALSPSAFLPPPSLSLSALPTLMTACHLAVAALAAFVGLASAEKEFPLVWICLGLTAVGILIALYVAYRRPMEPYSPEGPAAEPFDEGEERQESIAAPSQGAASHHSAHSSPKNTVLSSTSTCCKDLTLILYGNLLCAVNLPLPALTAVKPGGRTVRAACCTPGLPATAPHWTPAIDFHSSTTTIQDCAAAPLLLLACRRRCLAALDSRYVRSLCPLFPALSPSALPFFICSCCRSLAVVLFRLPPSYPPPTSLSLSPALPTLMTACHLAVAALAAFVGLASAEKEFPLVWICLGLTAVGILIALYVAYRRPMEPYSPEGPAAEPFDEGEERQESIAAPSQGAASHHSAHSSPKNTVLSSTSTCCKDLTLILYGNLVFSIHFPDGGIAPASVCCQLAPTGVDGGETWRTDGAGGVLYTWPPCHRAALDARLCSSATAVAGMQAPVPRRSGQSLRTVTVSTLSCPLPPSALPFFICSCCRCPAVVLFRLPPSYPPPTSLSLSPALPTLMTACHLAVAALAAFVGLASAEKEFPPRPYSPEGPAAEPFDEGEERQESIAAPSQGAASHHSAHSSPKNTVLSSTSTCCKDLTLILYGNLVFFYSFPPMAVSPPPVVVPVFVLFDAVSCVLSTCPYRPIGFHSSTTTIQDCAAAPLLLLACRRRCLAALDSRYVRSLCPLFPALSPSALPFFICSCCRSLAVVLFRLPPSYPPPTSLSLSPALPTLMTACHLAVAALAAFVGLASAEKEFPPRPYSPEGPAAEPFDEGEERQESIAAPSQGAASHHSAHSSPKNTVLSSTSTCCKDLTLILYGNLVFFYSFPPMAVSPPPVVVPVFVLFDALSYWFPLQHHHHPRLCSSATAVAGMQAPVPRRSGQSLRTVTVSTLSCPLPLRFAFLHLFLLPLPCSCALSPSAFLPPPTSLSLSPALPTLMTACHLAVAALAAFVGLASAEKEFPLVWICLGLTAVGILIALYVAYRRPMEPYSPEGPAAEPFDEGEERQESIAAPARVRPATTAPTAAPRTPCRRPASLPRCGLRHTPGSLSSTSTCCKDLTLILYGNLVFLFISPMALCAVNLPLPALTAVKPGGRTVRAACCTPGLPATAPRWTPGVWTKNKS
eukprot:gene3631-2566_t